MVRFLVRMARYVQAWSGPLVRSRRGNQDLRAFPAGGRETDDLPGPTPWSGIGRLASCGPPTSPWLVRLPAVVVRYWCVVRAAGLAAHAGASRRSACLPRSRRGPCPPAAGRLRYFCVDLGPRQRCVRHRGSLTSCVLAGERAGNSTWTGHPEKDSNLRPTLRRRSVAPGRIWPGTCRTPVSPAKRLLAGRRGYFS